MFSRYVLIKPPKPCGKKVGRVTTLDSRFMTIYCSIVWLNSSANSLKVKIFCLGLQSCTSACLSRECLALHSYLLSKYSSEESCTSPLSTQECLALHSYILSKYSSEESCTSPLSTQECLVLHSHLLSKSSSEESCTSPLSTQECLALHSYLLSESSSEESCTSPLSTKECLALHSRWDFVHRLTSSSSVESSLRFCSTIS